MAKNEKLFLNVLSAFLVTVCFNDYNRIFSFAFFLKLFLFLCIILRCSRVKLNGHVTIKILSLFEALCLILGKQLRAYDKTYPLMLLLTPLLMWYFWQVNSRIAEGFDFKFSLKLPTKVQNFIRSFWGKMLLIFGCHLLMYIILFPGIIFVDTMIAFEQDYVHSMHYSPLYSSIILLMVSLVNHEIIIPLMPLLNLILVSFIYVKTIELIEYKFSDQQILFTTLSIALSFFLSLWSITVAKDSLFMPLLGLTVAYIFVYYDDPARVNIGKLTVILLLACFLRNNLFYVLLLSIVLLLFIDRKSKLIKSAILACLLFFTYSTILTKVLHFETDGLREVISIPAQQLARVYTYQQDSLSPEEIKLLEDVTQGSIRYYIPVISDTIKDNLTNDSIRANGKELAMLWLKNLVKHPLTYIDATLYHTYYLWYPESIYKIYSDPTYSNYEVDYNGASYVPEEQYHNMKNVFDNHSYLKYQIVNNSFLTKLINRMLWFVNYERIPVISMLFSWGNFFWLFLTTYALSIYRKDRAVSMALGFVFIYLFSILFGPAILLRYIYILWILFPAEIIYLFRAKTT